MAGKKKFDELIDPSIVTGGVSWYGRTISNKSLTGFNDFIFKGLVLPPTRKDMLAE